METNVNKDATDLVQEVLDASKKTEVVTQDTAAKTDAAKETQDTKESKGGKAAERIQELVAERNRLADTLKYVQKESSEFKASYGELASLVEGIRELAAHENPEIRDAVILVDKALKGEVKSPTVASPQEQAERTNTDTKAHLELQEKVNKLERELRSKTEQTSHEVILSGYKNSAEKAIEALPSEYTNLDKQRIAKSFADFVDWDGVQREPLKIDNFVQTALDNVLKDYGPPAGKIEADVRKEYESKKPEAARLTPKEQMSKILAIPWDKVDEKGVPAMSDKDFVKAMAAAWKNDRGNL